jgi:hypothetical protein
MSMKGEWRWQAEGEPDIFLELDLYLRLSGLNRFARVVSRDSQLPSDVQWTDQTHLLPSAVFLKTSEDLVPVFHLFRQPFAVRGLSLDLIDRPLPYPTHNSERPIPRPPLFWIFSYSHLFFVKRTRVIRPCKMQCASSGAYKINQVFFLKANAYLRDAYTRDAFQWCLYERCLFRHLPNTINKHQCLK